eukprot:6079109-Karenia_brevis.AAC.1
MPHLRSWEKWQARKPQSSWYSWKARCRNHSVDEWRSEHAQSVSIDAANRTSVRDSWDDESALSGTAQSGSGTNVVDIGVQTAA